MSANSQRIKQAISKEAAVFLGLLFAGLVLLPVTIYLVGQSVFGAYGGIGFGDFYGALNEKVRDGDPVAWFLILSPNLGWFCVRLSVLAWRASARID